MSDLERLMASAASGLPMSPTEPVTTDPFLNPWTGKEWQTPNPWTNANTSLPVDADLLDSSRASFEKIFAKETRTGSSTIGDAFRKASESEDFYGTLQAEIQKAKSSTHREYSAWDTRLETQSSQPITYKKAEQSEWGEPLTKRAQPTEDEKLRTYIKRCVDDGQVFADVEDLAKFHERTNPAEAANIRRVGAQMEQDADSELRAFIVQALRDGKSLTDVAASFEGSDPDKSAAILRIGSKLHDCRRRDY